MTLSPACQRESDAGTAKTEVSQHPSEAQPIRLAVAASSAPCARVLADSFARQSGRKITVSSSSSGKLYAQIIQGAPYDLFLAADSTYPARLANTLESKSTPFYYATGSLVLFSRYADTPWSAALARCQVLVMANPRHAPYGRAAEAVLAQNGLQTKTIIAENVGQVMAMLLSSHADGGFLAASATAQVPLPAGWHSQTVPAEQYAPLHHWGLALTDDGKAFAAYLQSEAARSVLKANGYELR